MAVTSGTIPSSRKRLNKLRERAAEPFVMVPALSWLFGGLVAVLIEQLVGLQVARGLGLPRIPALFGVGIALDKPELLPSVILYDLVIYVIPTLLVSRLSATPGNWVSGKLFNFRSWLSVLLHVLLLYAILQVWAGVDIDSIQMWSGANEYRTLVVRLILIAILWTLSLNIINGYMGEFSCSHPGFIALGAYGASVFTVGIFVTDNVLGSALLPETMARYMFPIALVLGGLIASLGAILVAIPSFNTRGDYLAIISLAFMFMVKSLFENLEVVGGPRGLGGQPDLATLPTVFLWTIIGIWIMNNFVRSTLGKALNAVRDGETAADAMTVNTRKTKFTAFLFGAFWAGLAGGLFAHVIRYINPSIFGITMLAENLAMVYFGGLNSVQGSIVGAVSINLLGEGLRPLEIYKWLVIPLLLIIIMIRRPTGLISFTEFDFTTIIKPKQKPEGEV